MNHRTTVLDVTAADLMRSDVTTIPTTMRLDEVERLLAELDVGGAPVVDHAGRITGVVSLRDIAARHGEDPDARAAESVWSSALEGAPMRGGTQRRREFEAAAGAEPEQIAAGEREIEEIAAGGEGAARGPAGRSEDELELERMATGEGAPREGAAIAADVMTADVYVVGADARLTEIAAEMVRHGVHRLLVERSGAYVGMVTATDVLHALADHAT